MFKDVLFPCKSDDEIKGAEEKFAESLQHAQMGMYHLLENDVCKIEVVHIKSLNVKFLLRSSKFPKWHTSQRLCWTIISSALRFFEDWSKICKKSVFLKFRFLSVFLINFF